MRTSQLLHALCDRTHVRRLLIRASSTQAATDALAGLPRSFLKSLGAGWFTVSKVEGAGRGLMALQDIPQGTEVLREKPMLCIPAHQHMILPAQLQKRSQTLVCYHCLACLGSEAQYHPVSGQAFCSQTCLQDASRLYHEVESRADLGPLQHLCSKAGKARLPLMVARLACQHIASRAAQHGAGVTASSNSQPPSNPTQLLQGDPLKDMNFLCYANVPLPPEQWQQEWAALLRGLQPAAMWLAQQLLTLSSAPSPLPTSPSPQPASQHSTHHGNSPGSVETIAAGLLEGLSESWYVSCLSRLHVNVFRVDTVLMPSLGLGSGVDLAAQAAMMIGAEAGGEEGEGAGMGAGTGSAVYVTASLFNHSCEPNLDVVFPTNNNVAAFRAARDIAAGEQLTITYYDPWAAVALRQQHLKFAYGFSCRCTLCSEQLAEQSG